MNVFLRNLQVRGFYIFNKENQGPACVLSKLFAQAGY